MLPRCPLVQALLWSFICVFVSASDLAAVCEHPGFEFTAVDVNVDEYAACLLQHCEDASPAFFACTSFAGAVNCETQASGEVQVLHLCPGTCQTCVQVEEAFEDHSVLAEGQRSETEVSGEFTFSADVAGTSSAAALRPPVLAALTSTFGIRPADFAVLEVSAQFIGGESGALRGSEPSSQSTIININYKVVVPTNAQVPDVYRAARELAAPLDSEAYGEFSAALVLHGADVGIVNVGALSTSGGEVRLSNAPARPSVGFGEGESAGQQRMPQSGLRGSRAAAVAWVALALVSLCLCVALCARALRGARLQEGDCQAAETVTRYPLDDLDSILPAAAEARGEGATGVAGGMPTLLVGSPVRENIEADAKNS